MILIADPNRSSSILLECTISSRLSIGPKRVRLIYKVKGKTEIDIKTRWIRLPNKA